MAWLMRDGGGAGEPGDRRPPVATGPRACSGVTAFDGALLLRAGPVGAHVRDALPDRRGVPRRRPRRACARPTLRRCRMTMPVRGAHRVIEAEAGAFARWDLVVGDRLEVQGNDATPMATATARLRCLTARSSWSGRRSATSATSRPAPSRRSPRADVVCCEDTRRTGRLLEHAGVGRRPLLTVNDHTEARRDRRGPGPAGPGRAGGGGERRRDARHLRPGRAPGARPRSPPATRSRSCPGRRPRSPRSWPAACPTGRFAFEGFLPRKGSGRTERLAARRRRAAHDRALRGAAPARPHPRRPGRGLRRRPPGRRGPRAHQAPRGDVAGHARRGRRAGRRGRAPRRVRPRARRRTRGRRGHRRRDRRRARRRPRRRRLHPRRRRPGRRGPRRLRSAASTPSPPAADRVSVRCGSLRGSSSPIPSPSWSTWCAGSTRPTRARCPAPPNGRRPRSFDVGSACRCRRRSPGRSGPVTTRLRSGRRHRRTARRSPR